MHKCRFCEEEFTERDHLHRHEKVVHQQGARMHQCQHCDKMFADKDSFDEKII